MTAHSPIVDANDGPTTPPAHGGDHTLLLLAAATPPPECTKAATVSSPLLFSHDPYACSVFEICQPEPCIDQRKLAPLLLPPPPPPPPVPWPTLARGPQGAAPYGHPPPPPPPRQWVRPSPLSTTHHSQHSSFSFSSYDTPQSPCHGTASGLSTPEATLYPLRYQPRQRQHTAGPPAGSLPLSSCSPAARHALSPVARSSPTSEHLTPPSQFAQECLRGMRGGEPRWVICDGHLPTEEAVLAPRRNCRCRELAPPSYSASYSRSSEYVPSLSYESGSVTSTSTQTGLSADTEKETLEPRKEPSHRPKKVRADWFGSPPAFLSTADQELKRLFGFTPFPTHDFAVPADAKLPGEDAVLVRVFIGQLPLSVTNSQLAWLCYVFGNKNALIFVEPITKRSNGRVRRPTGCVHAYCSRQGAMELAMGMHKRLFIGDAGVFCARNDVEVKLLAGHIAESKRDPVAKRRPNRPSDSVVLQYATSTYVPSEVHRTARLSMATSILQCGDVEPIDT